MVSPSSGVLGLGLRGSKHATRLGLLGGVDETLTILDNELMDGVVMPVIAVESNNVCSQSKEGARASAFTTRLSLDREDPDIPANRLIAI